MTIQGLQQKPLSLSFLLPWVTLNQEQNHSSWHWGRGFCFPAVEKWGPDGESGEQNWSHNPPAASPCLLWAQRALDNGRPLEVSAWCLCLLYRGRSSGRCLNTWGFLSIRVTGPRGKFPPRYLMRLSPAVCTPSSSLLSGLLLISQF